MRGLKKRKGSSSILIIMIIITLVLFGILSVISAYSSFRLSEKSASYLAMNLELEDIASGVKAQIVGKMRKAEEEALQYARAHPGEDNRRIYWERLKEAISEIDPAELAELKEFRREEREEGLRILALAEKSYPAGVERFSMEIELQRPSNPILSPGDAKYRTLRWKKMPKEMDYEDVMEFENIEIEAPKEEVP